MDIDAERIAEIIDKKVPIVGKLDGRYLITFYLRKVDQENTTVTVVPLIIVNTESESTSGGQIVTSNGTLRKNI